LTKLDDATGSVRDDNSFTLVDDMTLVRGRNTIRFDLTIHRYSGEQVFPSVADEIYTYTSLNNFASNIMDSDSYAGMVPLIGQRMTQTVGYVMDPFQLNPHFTAIVD
jgi:hypothetical protein